MNYELLQNWCVWVVITVAFAGLTAAVKSIRFKWNDGERRTYYEALKGVPFWPDTLLVNIRLIAGWCMYEFMFRHLWGA